MGWDDAHSSIQSKKPTQQEYILFIFLPEHKIKAAEEILFIKETTQQEYILFTMCSRELVYL